MSIEKWLPVTGFEGYYEVSDYGRVRSVERKVRDERGFYRPIRSRILKQPFSGGYPSVTLHRHPLPRRKVRVHHLVLETFVGPRPDGQHGCHFDDNPLNNHINNLRWDTPTSNRLDETRNGNNVNANKTHCPNGHEYAGWNLVVGRRGNGQQFRMCRTCMYERSRKRNQSD